MKAIDAAGFERSLSAGGNGCDLQRAPFLFLWTVGLLCGARFERPQLGGTNGICERVHARIKFSTENEFL